MRIGLKKGHKWKTENVRIIDGMQATQYIILPVLVYYTNTGTTMILVYLLLYTNTSYYTTTTTTTILLITFSTDTDHTVL